MGDTAIEPPSTDKGSGTGRDDNSSERIEGSRSNRSNGNAWRLVAIFIVAVIILLLVVSAFLLAAHITSYVREPDGRGVQASPPTPPHGVATLADHTIVVARFNENLRWLAPYASRVIVYNKGGEDDVREMLPGAAEVHALPNVGREAHTFLTFILDRWDTLPARVTFFQGAWATTFPIGLPWTLSEATVTDTLRDGLPLPATRAVFNPNFSLSSYRGQRLKPAGMNMGAFWHKYMPADEPWPTMDRFCVYWGGYMSVTRNAIRSRPRAFYAALLETVSYANAPQAAHFLERMWFHIFHH